MKPFRFSLQAVLTLRQRQEQGALQEYGAALRSYREGVNAMETAQREMEHAWRSLQQELNRGSHAGRLHWAGEYCRGLEQKCEKQRREVKRLESRLESRRQALLKAQAEREAVEKFHDRQRRYHQLEVRRAEEKAVEDLLQGRQSRSSTAVNSLSTENYHREHRT